MDVDSGFKVIKIPARTTTSVGKNTPLKIVVNRAFEDMRNNNQLKLSNK